MHARESAIAAALVGRNFFEVRVALRHFDLGKTAGVQDVGFFDNLVAI